MTVTRQQLVETLCAAVRPREDVNAAWLGGSDAFGASDHLSDVDLCVDVADGAAAAVLDAVEEALRSLSPIQARWDVPEPSWHGHAQRFYRLEDAPETLLLDVVAMERSSAKWRFDEREAHGEPVVLFDKLGIVRSKPLDRAANAAAMRARRRMLALRETIFGGFAEKESARGRTLDAFGFHQAFLLGPLVEILRMRYCPERYTFALRYLDRDLPPDVVAKLRSLAFVSDADDLRRKSAVARAWLREEITRADAAEAPERS